MKQYVGRFPVNKALTKKVNKEGWVIYRDPENGLYAYNEKLDEEVNLMLWNESARDVKPMTLECIRHDIEELERELAELGKSREEARDEAVEQMTIYIRTLVNG